MEFAPALTRPSSFQGLSPFLAATNAASVDWFVRMVAGKPKFSFSEPCTIPEGYCQPAAGGVSPHYNPLVHLANTRALPAKQAATLGGGIIAFLHEGYRHGFLHVA